MKAKRILVLRQVTQNRWRLENSKGDVLLDDLMLESLYRAEEWIKGYVSSFNNYRYEIIPLTRERK